MIVECRVCGFTVDTGRDPRHLSGLRGELHPRRPARGRTHLEGIDLMMSATHDAPPERDEIEEPER